MLRWPDLDPTRIVFEDDALIVVDKPVGVPSQESHHGSADDLPSRLRRVIAERDSVGAEKVYLGIHQHLDQEASGLVAYARARTANPSLATQFEGRSIRQVYVAAVEGFRGEGWSSSTRPNDPSRTARPGAAHNRDRRDRPAPARPEASKPLSQVRVLARHDTRALLEITLDTTRTQLIRTQLAEASSPIVGDRVHGGPSASRLLLHARDLVLAHPLDGRRLTLSAQLPGAFDRWLAEGPTSPLDGEHIDVRSVQDILAAACERRLGLARSAHGPADHPQTVQAYRLLHEDGDGLPGVAVDVYGEHLVLHLHEEQLHAKDVILAALEPLGARGVYLKVRPRQANNVVETRTDVYAPKLPIVGSAPDDEFEIREHGLPLLVRLGDGLSTGLFLDQRENRQRVRNWSAGRRVLNLFAYTGSFTIAAAAGGASRTVTVDASRAVIDRAERGLKHAGLAGDHHAMVVDDVFSWIKRTRERFDLVILDPPSYSKVGTHRFSTASDYRELAASVMRLIAPEGRVIACSNHRQTVMAKFRRWLHEAAREAQREVVQMKDLDLGLDFPPFGREPHLKSVAVTLR